MKAQCCKSSNQRFVLVSRLQSSGGHPDAAAATTLLLPDLFFHTGLVGPCRLNKPCRAPRSKAKERRCKKLRCSGQQSQSKRLFLSPGSSGGSVAELFVIHENGD